MPVVAEPEEVRQERRAGDERGEPDDDVAAGADPLERVEHVLVAERAVVAVAADRGRGARIAPATTTPPWKPPPGVM